MVPLSVGTYSEGTTSIKNCRYHGCYPAIERLAEWTRSTKDPKSICMACTFANLPTSDGALAGQATANNHRMPYQSLRQNVSSKSAG